MLRTQSLPASLSGLLTGFRGCFTAPTFRTFVSLLCGLIAQPGRRTVTGMLVAAGLAGQWPHQRAHRFFSRAVWDVEHVSLVLLRLVVDTLVAAGAALQVVVDDSLFKRTGKKVHAARWQHDGSATGPTRHQTGRGNGWVVACVNVKLPFLDRVIGIPVGFALWGEQPSKQPNRKATKKKATKKTTPGAAAKDEGPTKQVLACRLVTRIAEAYPDRKIHVVADAWYAGMGGAQGAARGGTRQRSVPDNVTITSRPRSNSSFTAIHKPAEGAKKKRGRARTRGESLGNVAQIAATASYTATTVTRYAKTATVKAADVTCLWYGVYRCQPIRLILVLDDNDHAKPYALITTDLDATTAEIISRYANRWAIEVVFSDAKNITGVGEAHNRTPDAVRRTVPFGLIAQAITIIWYAQHGHTPDTAAQRRAAAPWYRSKTTPSFQDMIVKLRRVLIAAKFRASCGDEPTPKEIQAVRQAWAEVEAA
jgi:hypothetical protein